MHATLPESGTSILPMLVVLLAALTPALQAEPPFEVAISGTQTVGCYFLPASFPLLEWVNPDGFQWDSRIQEISSDGHRILGISTTGAGVVEIFRDGSRISFFRPPAGYGLWAIAVARNARVFLSVTTNGFRGIAVVSPGGVLEATHPWPTLPYGVNVAEIAVADDNCTIFYATHGAVGRMNGCTGAVLSDFAAVSGNVHDLSILPNGNVLLATGEDVVLYDGSGVVIRMIASVNSYALHAGIRYAAHEVAPSPDLKSLWIAAMSGCEDGHLLNVNLNDGTELSRRRLAMNSATGLVVGEPGVPVPAVTDGLLLLLALSLAMAGLSAVALR